MFPVPSVKKTFRLKRVKLNFTDAETNGNFKMTNYS